MDYLALLNEIDEPRYFLSLLSCGTTFSDDSYRGSRVTGNGYNQAIRDFISKCQANKKPLSFDEWAHAIDEGLSKSTCLEYMYPEILGHTGLTLKMIDEEKGQNFCHYLLKKYKNIDFIEDNTTLPVEKAMTSCLVDDYVMSFQKHINHTKALDEYLTQAMREILTNKDIIGVSDIGIFKKQKDFRTYHEYIITSIDENPVNPTMFGKILEKSIEFIINKEDLKEGIKEIMEFCKLQYSIENGKKPATHLKI